MTGAIDTQAIFNSLWGEADGVYTSTRNSGDATAALASFCRYSLGVAEAAASDGVYLKGDEKVTFALGALPWDPKPRDLFAPPGESPRIVVEATPYRWLKYWDLKVRNLTLAYDLMDLCTVRRSVPTPGSSGLRVRNPTDFAADVPCRLQPVDVSVDFDDDRVNQTARYTAYLGRPLELIAGDTLVVAGVEYEVTGQAHIAELDGLTTVDCQRVA